LSVRGSATHSIRKVWAQLSSQGTHSKPTTLHSSSDVLVGGSLPRSSKPTLSTGAKCGGIRDEQVAYQRTEPAASCLEDRWPCLRSEDGNMPPTPLRTFQAGIVSRLQGAGLEARTEWGTVLGSLGCYSPRLDVAAGPFASDNLRCGHEYDVLQETHSNFLEELIRHHSTNVPIGPLNSRTSTLEDFRLANPNARCFLAIEIENKVSRKHLLGGRPKCSSPGSFRNRSRVG
jgi:hypothetical protein